MTVAKKKIALIFGGKSAEHEVSVRSVKNVYEALDKNKFEPVLIGISHKMGHWYWIENPELDLKAMARVEDQNPSPRVHAITLTTISGKLQFQTPNSKVFTVDCAFPIMHGTIGEDGSIQGLFETLNVPYVGSGVLSSAVGMDKDFMKRLFKEAGLAVAPFKVLHRHDLHTYTFAVLGEKLGTPFFIKPANAGSSVGVHKVKNEVDFNVAIADAFRFDFKIIAERFIKGREIECAVLGRTYSAKASIPGEVIPTHEFYSYEAKYLDENGARIEIPAKLKPDVIHRVQEASIRAFSCLECEGLSRVDFFYSEAEDEIYINEINTLPGFTNISMYPQMWKASGVDYSTLITKLIEIAVERFEERQKLKTSYLAE